MVLCRITVVATVVLSGIFVVAAVVLSCILVVAVATTTSTFLVVALHQLFQQLVYLPFGGRAVLYHAAFKGQQTTGQRVIGVNGDMLCVDGSHLSVEGLPLWVLHGNDGTHVDIFLVKVALHVERIAWQHMHSFGVILSEAL